MTQNLSSYRIFYVVAKCGNISKAAKELFISQPAISKSIRKLEESLETTLFIRSSKGVRLTDEGEILFSHVEEAFSILDDGEKQLQQNIKLGIGHLRIGVSTTLCKYMLMPYLSRFIKENPNVKISIVCQDSNDSLKMIAENKLDLGFVGMFHHIKDIDFTPVVKTQDIFVASPDYLANLEARGVKPENYFHEGMLMLLDKNNQARTYVDTVLKEFLDSSDHIEITTMDLLIDFSKIGLGIGCVIRSFVEEDLKKGTLVEIPSPLPLPPRDVGFAYKKNAIFTKAVSDFINISKQ
jgi:DNA-binding transcriptional LysR family regulator